MQLRSTPDPPHTSPDLPRSPPRSCAALPISPHISPDLPRSPPRSCAALRASTASRTRGGTSSLACRWTRARWCCCCLRTCCCGRRRLTISTRASRSRLRRRTGPADHSRRSTLPHPAPKPSSAHRRPRLFSSSLTPHDLDNFLCHSCDPNCDVVVGPDLCVGFVARRPLAAGESLTFDYDSTEDDLTGDRGGFECFCGAPLCRGLILGKLHSPAAGAAKRLGSPLLPPPRDSSPAAP